MKPWVLDLLCRFSVRCFRGLKKSSFRFGFLFLFAACALAVDEDRFYKLGPDSLPQEGVPKGKIIGPATLPSDVYPGTQHTYWVYVPAQ